MDLQWRDGDSEARFSAYVEHLSLCLGHADRAAPFRSYCTGLLLPGDRKSVEPMAARLSPERTSAEHQSLLHFVGQSAWDETALLRAVRAAVLPVLTERHPVEAWIVDDTGFPKKGVHSVGVARQYCGQIGKKDNCQVAVSLSLATAEASLPVAWQLLLVRDQGRNMPDAPANHVLSKVRLQVLRAISQRPLGANPTAHEVMYAIAGLGGHLKRNGRPGWQTLSAGMEKLLTAELGWLARGGAEM